MREIERQQREAEENADKIFDMHNSGKKFIILAIHTQHYTEQVEIKFYLCRKQTLQFSRGMGVGVSLREKLSAERSLIPILWLLSNEQECNDILAIMRSSLS